MKLSTIAIGTAALFAAGPVLSQGADCTSVALKAIPACAQHCFLEGAPTMGCGGLDFACQCRQEAAMHAAIESCVASSCASSQFQSIIDGAATGKSRDAPTVCMADRGNSLPVRRGIIW